MTCGLWIKPFYDEFHRPRVFPWINGIVPFSIATSFGEEEKKLIRRMITRLTVLLKVETTDGARYAVMFVEKPPSYSDKPHCRIAKAAIKASSANIGMPSGWGYSSLTLFMRNDIPDGEILHELCHVLGLFHEHCRPDRDLHVFIPPITSWYDTINAGKKTRDEYVHPGILDLPYDCNSIMHYRHELGIVPYDTAAVSPKRGETLTSIDVEKLHLVYPPRYTLEEMRQHGATLEESELRQSPQPLHTPSFDEWTSVAADRDAGRYPLSEATRVVENYCTEKLKERYQRRTNLKGVPLESEQVFSCNRCGWVCQSRMELDVHHHIVCIRDGEHEHGQPPPCA